MENNIETKYNKLIVVLSVAIPAVVALLFGVNLRKLGYDVEPLSFLPPIYATINGLTAVVLVAAVVAIKNGNRKLHENLMKVAIGCSVAFLAMYVAYHMTSDSTKFGGEGAIRYIYFFILITHILLWYFRQATNVEIIAAIFNEYKIITSFRCSLLLNDL